MTAGPITEVAKFGCTAPPELAARLLVILIALAVPVELDANNRRYGWVPDPVLTTVAETPMFALLIADARPLRVLFVESIVIAAVFEPAEIWNVP